MCVNTCITFAGIWFLLSCVCFAVPAKRSTAATATDDSATRTEVDGHNRKEILALFNLTEDQMSRISAGLYAAKKEAEANGSIYFNNIREFQ